MMRDEREPIAFGSDDGFGDITYETKEHSESSDDDNTLSHNNHVSYSNAEPYSYHIQS